MKRTPLRHAAQLGALALLLTRAAHAQLTPPAPAAPAPAPNAPVAAPGENAPPIISTTPPPPPVIAPGAPEPLVLLNRLVATQTALKSYSATQTARVMVKEKSALEARSQFAFQKPNRVVSKTVTQGTSVTLVCNGTHFFITNSTDKKRYAKGKPPVGSDAIAQILSGVLPSEQGAFFLLGKNVVAQVQKSWNFVSVTSSETLVSKVPVWVLDMSFKDATEPFTLSLAVGKADNLLYRVDALQTTAQNGEVHIIEEYSDIKVNPVLPAATFVFVPPQGAVPLLIKGPNSQFDIGSTPTPFTATDLAGKPLSLAGYKGKVVLLHFWATQLSASTEPFPELVRAYKKYHPQGLEMVGITLDQTDRQVINAFLSLQGVTWRQVTNKQSKVVLTTQYGVKALPYALLIGRDGKVAAIDATGTDLDAAIRAALAKKAG